MHVICIVGFDISIGPESNILYSRDHGVSKSARRGVSVLALSLKCSYRQSEACKGRESVLEAHRGLAEAVRVSIEAVLLH